MNRKLLGVAGILVILGIAFAAVDEPPRDPAARRRRGVRAAGGRSPCSCFNTTLGVATIQALSSGVANLLGYASKGTEFLFGPARHEPARQQLRHRRACR